MSKPLSPQFGWNLRHTTTGGFEMPPYWEYRTKHLTGIMSLRAYIRTDASDTPLSAAVWRTGRGWDDVDLPPGLSLEEVKLHIEALLALEN